MSRFTGADAVLGNINVRTMSDLPVKCYESERLQYRPLQPEDCEAVYEYGKDRETCRFLMWGPYKNIEEANVWIQRKIKENDLQWVIVEKKEQKVIGAIRLYNDKEINSMAVSYILNKKYTGKGYMTESVKAAFLIAKEIKAEIVYAYCAVDNKKSEQVMIRAGMKCDQLYTEKLRIKNHLMIFKRYFKQLTITSRKCE